mmetsp:Transcript_43695/g.50536  ORF Transcript_43695/g.50536 Transcript_43695/m.50536 type:complete len:84 (-) Transcript_43695:617-868(-)
MYDKVADKFPGYSLLTSPAPKEIISSSADITLYISATDAPWSDGASITDSLANKRDMRLVLCIDAISSAAIERDATLAMDAAT